MTPAQFVARVKRNEMPPVCLFLGQEGYNRRRCREALLAAAQGIEPEQHDLAEIPLAAVIDDARAHVAVCFRAIDFCAERRDGDAAFEPLGRGGRRR